MLMFKVVQPPYRGSFSSQELEFALRELRQSALLRGRMYFRKTLLIASSPSTKRSGRKSFRICGGGFGNGCNCILPLLQHMLGVSFLNLSALQYGHSTSILPMPSSVSPM